MGKKISGLDELTTLTGNEELVVIDPSETDNTKKAKKVKQSTIRNDASEAAGTRQTNLSSNPIGFAQTVTASGALTKGQLVTLFQEDGSLKARTNTKVRNTIEIPSGGTSFKDNVDGFDFNLADIYFDPTSFEIVSKDTEGAVPFFNSLSTGLTYSRSFDKMFEISPTKFIFFSSAYVNKTKLMRGTISGSDVELSDSLLDQRVINSSQTTNISNYTPYAILFSKENGEWVCKDAIALFNMYMSKTKNANDKIPYFLTSSGYSRFLAFKFSDSIVGISGIPSGSVNNYLDYGSDYERESSLGSIVPSDRQSGTILKLLEIKDDKLIPIISDLHEDYYADSVNIKDLFNDDSLGNSFYKNIKEISKDEASGVSKAILNHGLDQAEDSESSTNVNYAVSIVSMSFSEAVTGADFNKFDQASILKTKALDGNNYYPKDIIFNSEDNTALIVMGTSRNRDGLHTAYTYGYLIYLNSEMTDFKRRFNTTSLLYDSSNVFFNSIHPNYLRFLRDIFETRKSLREENLFDNRFFFYWSNSGLNVDKYIVTNYYESPGITLTTTLIESNIEVLPSSERGSAAAAIIQYGNFWGGDYIAFIVTEGSETSGGSTTNYSQNRLKIKKLEDVSVFLRIQGTAERPLVLAVDDYVDGAADAKVIHVAKGNVINFLENIILGAYYFLDQDTGQITTESRSASGLRNIFFGVGISTTEVLCQVD